MTDTQTINYEKILADDADENAKITFTPRELKFFALELKDMITAGEFDIAKALHSARFYAEMERRTADIKAGKNLKTFTAEEWERFTHE